MTSINSAMKTYDVILLCGFTIPYLIWIIRYLKIQKELEKKNLNMFFYTCFLSILLSLNQFVINLIPLDIWVFLLLQVSLLPFLMYFDSDIRRMYKNKQK